MDGKWVSMEWGGVCPYFHFWGDDCSGFEGVATLFDDVFVLLLLLSRTLDLILEFGRAGTRRRALLC